MADRLPRKLAAILYADVAGYSRLTGQDEDATHRALSEYLDLISTTIESHRGQVKHYAGDAVLADFIAVVDAVSGAVAIQDEIRARNEGLPDNLKLQFRIGVNVGDVIEDRGDIYGDGVNVAARLESLAQPGGICISDAVRTAIGKKLPYVYASVGERRVKNIEEPVRAYQIVLNPESPRGPSPDEESTASVAPEQSIAVLPFSHLGGDQEEEHFADGLADDIITELSKNPDLVVIARNTSFAYKGVRADVRELGEKLSARYLLTGGIRRTSDRLRVSAQLCETTTGYSVWAETYERDLGDVFAAQDEIVEGIISAIGGTGGKLDELLRATVSKAEKGLAARDYFLRARDYLNRYSVNDEEFSRAKEMFEKAIELDPTFFRAYLGLAWYHIQEIKFQRTKDPEYSLQEASDLTRRAVGLDEPTAWSHMILGQVATYRRQFSKALAHYEHALASNPSEPFLLMVISDGLNYMGRSDEAIDLALKAIQLNRSHPFWYEGVLAFGYFTARKYAEAQSVLERMDDLRLSPRLHIATYAKLGQLEKARAAAKEFLEDNPGFSIASWAATQPYENPADLQDYVDGLRMAGLPD